MRASTQRNGSELSSSAHGHASVSDSPKPVWVTHTPTPDTFTDDGHDSMSCHSTSPYIPTEGKGSLKKRLQSLLLPSWGSNTRKETGSNSEPSSSIAAIQILPNGTRVSPPVSPILERRDLRKWEGWHGDADSYPNMQEDSVLSSLTPPAEQYAEKLQLYRLKYSYLKSWPGLLRLLAGLQLLFGGMVFACVIAYIQRDSEWSNTYGPYNGAYNSGQGVSGYSYGGPLTALVLALAGLSWVVTLCLLVVGMSLYYRSILLDSSWWPLTEAFINVALFLLYMAAGIVYLNDLNRGGLCYISVGVNPILANLCRVDGGQMAAAAFLFINMSLYLGSFLVCLKMWRHEAAQRTKLSYTHTSRQSSPASPPEKRHISFRKVTAKPSNEKLVHAVRPEVTPCTSSPRVQIVADYIVKYPEITCVEEREKYRAVFNDQYQEYRDLHGDVSHVLSRFAELEVMMKRLPVRGTTQEEQQRIGNIWRKLNQKKNDATFLEKKERCDYLKAKLKHIKTQIRSFDQQGRT